MNNARQTYRGIEIKTEVLTYTDARLYVVMGSPWKFSSLESARKYIRTNKWAAERAERYKAGPALCGEPNRAAGGA